ncbi:MAG: hypothetical protein QM679_02570 [Patulibacter sp.]
MSTQITLDLHGANAPDGINIAEFERFLAEFRTALRVFSRERREQVPNTAGRPSSDDDAATAFRLTSLRAGSAIMELTDLSPATGTSDGQPSLDIEVATTATDNLVSLMRAVEADAVSPKVGLALGKARRALGVNDGCFGVAVQGRVARVQIDRERVDRWSISTPDAAGGEVTSATGRLHAFETEAPPHVEVRDQDGRNWTCSYRPELEARLLSAVRRLVTLEGEGIHDGKKGRLQVTSVHVSPELEPSTMFTSTPLSVDELMEAQGIAGPQTLESLAIPGLTDDERDAFLAAIFDA